MGTGWVDYPTQTVTNTATIPTRPWLMFRPPLSTCCQGLGVKLYVVSCVGPFTTTTQTSGDFQGGCFRFRRSSPAERCHRDPVNFAITPPSVPNAAVSTAATGQGSNISTSVGTRGNLLAKWSTTPVTRPRVTPVCQATLILTPSDLY